MPVFTASNWDKTLTTSKKGFDTAWGWADKLGAPVNKLTNKIGSEAFWPTTLDKEADKAARILQSFCKDGFYSQDEDTPMSEEARNLARYSKQRVVKKIPQEVISKAKGLAIFTTMRSGLWVSGAGGSGVLLARMENGEWSPPSGILIHTAAVGFVFGADIYDCVVVINNQKALDAFKAVRATLGGEISAVAGPVGIGGIVDTTISQKQVQVPCFTYMKSRGFYAGLGANGSIIIERKDENERFYGEKIGVSDILKGKIRHPPKHELNMLWTTIRAAQGDKDINREFLPDDRPSPGDLQYERMSDQGAFGLPGVDDPDPFGVHALEEEGFEIREAGTGTRPPDEVFEYKPAPSSPAYAVLHRKSIAMDPNPQESAGSSRRSSGTRKGGKMSNPWVVPYADDGTQTMEEEARAGEMAQEALRPARNILSLPLPVRSTPPPPLPPRSRMSPVPPSTPVIDEEVGESGDYAAEEFEREDASAGEPEYTIMTGEEDEEEEEAGEPEHRITMHDSETAPHYTVAEDEEDEPRATDAEGFDDVDIHGHEDHSAVTTPGEYKDAIPGAFQ